METAAYTRPTSATIETYNSHGKTTNTRNLAPTQLQLRRSTPNMCYLHTIDEHDRLLTTIELLHAAGQMSNKPVDIYRLHAYFVTTDEREDDVANANEEVGLAFAYGHVGNGGAEDEAMPDAIEDFLDGTWPSDGRVNDEDVVESGRARANEEEERSREKETERLNGDHMQTNSDTSVTAAATDGADSRLTNNTASVAPAASGIQPGRPARLATRNNAVPRTVRARNE
jgi:hypothetical protein